MAVRRLLLLDPTVHHRLNVVGGVVVVVVVPGKADVVVVGGDGDGGVIVGVVAAAIPIVAVPIVAVPIVAAAQVRKRGGVHAVRARVVVGRVAGIVPRLETVETRIAVVRALVQDRGYGGDAGPRASFALLLPSSYLDHHCRLAPSAETFVLIPLVISALFSFDLLRNYLLLRKIFGMISITSRLYIIYKFRNFSFSKICKISNFVWRMDNEEKENVIRD